MYFKAKTLDDVLRRVLKKLTKEDAPRMRASRGNLSEITGVLFQITHPRARLSRTEKRGLIFSPLGELFWYLAGTDSLKQIEYYVPKYRDESVDKKTVYGAYGPRLFEKKGINQVSEIIQLLKKRPASRRAVVQLFEARDLTHEKPPCTCTLQFLIRDNRLQLLVNMRSNDAFIGLPHDIFAFTMIQELVARSLGLEIGPYKHMVGSLHLYDKHLKGAKAYLSEEWQETAEMPQMPPGDPWKRVKQVVALERNIRNGTDVNIKQLKLERYWEDILRLFQIYHIVKVGGDTRSIGSIKKMMSTKIYDPYIDQRRRKSENAVENVPFQPVLSGIQSQTE
jgi:thymidylate synthase